MSSLMHATPGFTRVRLVAGIFVFLATHLACADDSPPEPVTSAAVVPDRPTMSGEALMRALACGACHAGLPVLDSIAPRLDSFDDGDADRVLARLRPTSGAHPDFHLDDREVVVLARYLGVDAVAGTTTGVDATAGTELNAADGERLFAALNCAGCHDRTGAQPVRNAPALALEGDRVRAEWLREFLRSPRAVRPFGARPGDGGRMPRFALREAEIDSLTQALTRTTRASAPFVPTPLSARAENRIETLLTTRYSCLGCHRLDGTGGRIGPDLSAAGGRLNSDYIRAILERPGHLAPTGVMPPTLAPPGALDELASFLAARAGGTPDADERAGYLSPLDHSMVVRTADATADLYATRCSACHGAGRGDGYNAAFLRVRPADHTDARAMAGRTDARLYDAIAGGARFLNGSPGMPAFPDLTPDQIRSLVAYIRTLCSCEQPAWAGDGNGTVS